MGSYSVRPAQRALLTLEGIEAACRKHFGVGDRAADSVVARFGAIEELRACPAKTEIRVDLRMNPQVESAVAGETIRRYNHFLEEITGYSAKERAQRARKAALAAKSSG